MFSQIPSNREGFVTLASGIVFQTVMRPTESESRARATCCGKVTVGDARDVSNPIKDAGSNVPLSGANVSSSDEPTVPLVTLRIAVATTRTMRRAKSTDHGAIRLSGDSQWVENLPTKQPHTLHVCDASSIDGETYR